MGSPFNILIFTIDSLQAAQAAEATFLFIDTLNGIYSDYLPESELNRLCQTAGTGNWVKVSEPLFSVLSQAKEASVQSSGSFDITLTPVIKLWRKARKNNVLPSKDSIEHALTKVGYRNILLDTINRSVKLVKEGMQLDLGGIAKGETAQRAYHRLSLLGFTFSLIDAGGDIVAGNTPPGVPGWKIAINLPSSDDIMQKQLLLNNMAVTTSGDLYQYMELNGIRYSHIINPATGWATTSSRNVTVISPKGIDADWLTKAATVLPVKKALRLIKKYPSTEVQIAILHKGKPRYFRSAGFASYFQKAN